jgi:RNA polymerase sigma-70 factor (ECF subfamily)
MNTEDPLHTIRLDSRIERDRAELLAFLRRRAPQDAEELAQEVWLRVARAAPDCPDEARFRAYVFAIARRLLIDHHRRCKARIELVALAGGVDAACGGVSDPESQLEAGDVLSTVEAALADMKPEIADVFRWRMTEDTSFQQIALRQGVGLNTALGRMFRATQRIAEALGARGLLPREEER